MAFGRYHTEVMLGVLVAYRALGVAAGVCQVLHVLGERLRNENEKARNSCRCGSGRCGRHRPVVCNHAISDQEASFSDRYSNTWPISRPDFARVECLVKEELGWREIITDVAVPGPDEVRIRTTSRRSVEGQAGHRFIVRKVNGEWAIVKRTAWASLFGIT